jgi:hypothetical protein
LDPVEEVHQLEHTPLCRTLALLVIQTHDELTRDNYIHQSHDHQNDRPYTEYRGVDEIPRKRNKECSNQE